MRPFGHKLDFEAPFRGAPQTVALIKQYALQAQNDPSVRLLAEEIIQGVPSKDYVSEILSIYYFCLEHLNYTNDPRTVELVRRPERLIAELMSGKRPRVDCLPGNTLLLREDYELVPLKDITPGTKIWGYDRWSVVTNAWSKGKLPVDVIYLNNGSTIRATSDHKFYVKVCPKGHAKATNCKCEFVTKRIRGHQLKPGMEILTPDSIPFGEEKQDPRRSIIEGFYLSDGWHQSSSFCISGKDGFPKEAQKKEVATICETLGVATTWYERFISVRDSEWASRVKLMGGKAPQKKALSIALEEAASKELLRGIMADAGKNTHGGYTLTTTSRDLFLQARLLHKMQGKSCSERFIVDHGGLGKNPIWRLGVREPINKPPKRLLVKAIERNVCEEEVFDISTDDHYVYLPEADATVSNCDDLACFLTALLLSIGREMQVCTVAFRTAYYRGEKQYGHVYCQAKEPRSRQWIVLDPVAAEETKKMLGRVKEIKIWPVA